MIVVGSNPSP